MSPNPLSEMLFKATMEDKMTDVTKEPGACIDIWPYVNMVRESVGLPQKVIDNYWVEYVYRSRSGHHDHILIPTGRHNVFLVIVADRVHGSVYGHRVLDLNAEYGLTELGIPKH